MRRMLCTRQSVAYHTSSGRRSLYTQAVLTTVVHADDVPIAVDADAAPETASHSGPRLRSRFQTAGLPYCQHGDQMGR
uniref:Uncharacterized protein n=1 Tax=uncultured SAR11 cluster alpha proteobacterium H17925_45G17 TaxID=715038 RepID=E7CA52_9PROT|nr:hypothetical protein [uncultured SAR11 cluster alpha proteobacterium H17925_45G17]